MVLHIIMGPGITWLPRWYHVDTTLIPGLYHADTTLIPHWDTILKVSFHMQVHNRKIYIIMHKIMFLFGKEYYFSIWLYKSYTLIPRWKQRNEATTFTQRGLNVMCLLGIYGVIKNLESCVKKSIWSSMLKNTHHAHNRWKKAHCTPGL